MGKMASVDLLLLDRELELDINTWQQLNILSRKQAHEILPKTDAFKQYYLFTSRGSCDVAVTWQAK